VTTYPQMQAVPHLQVSAIALSLPIKTSGLRILTKGYIAVLSPLLAVNRFVRPWPSYNTCFLGCTRVSLPNGILISSAVYAYTAAYAPNAFQCGGQPQNCSFPLRDWGPHLKHPPSQSPNNISIGSAVFAGLMNLSWHHLRRSAVPQIWLVPTKV